MSSTCGIPFVDFWAHNNQVCACVEWELNPVLQADICSCQIPNIQWPIVYETYYNCKFSFSFFSKMMSCYLYTTVTPHYFQSCLCIKFMMYINRLVNHSDPNFDITSNYGSLQCSRKCLRPLYECSLMSVPFSEKSKRTTKLTKISIICLMHPMNHCTQMSS